jgi:hypothetical protein
MSAPAIQLSHSFPPPVSIKSHIVYRWGPPWPTPHCAFAARANQALLHSSVDGGFKWGPLHSTPHFRELRRPITHRRDLESCKRNAATSITVRAVADGETAQKKAVVVGGGWVSGIL